MDRSIVSAALLMAVVPHLASAQSAPSPEAQAVRWTCGGVGAEERRDLAARARESNLEITFTTQKRGAFVAGVEVELRPTGAGTAQRFVAEGPICAVDAAPGTWRLSATLNGVERTREVRLGARGKPGTKVALAFPDEPSDGIRATEEEKAQARKP